VPERLDRVEVLAGRGGSVTISWDAREQLLERLGDIQVNAHTVDAFRSVGASRPVPLELPDKQILSVTIEDWIAELGGYTRLPEGIYELRAALIDDLHDAGLGP
jgi:hypothetical protein